MRCGYRIFNEMKFAVFLSLLLCLTATAWAEESPWVGKWEFERYAYAVGGVLNINNCHKSKCNFEIFTSHGSHSCHVDGTMIINGNKAKYFSHLTYGEDGKILFTLNPKKRIIDVEHVSGRFCGMRGYIDGSYEHESLPYRYPTSFDCWANNLSLAEKTICSSPKLSKADIELSVNYPDIKTAEWINLRNKCADNEKCLNDFYHKEIFDAFERVHHKKFNFYDYALSQKQKWYFPTDLMLLDDFLINSMDNEYYEAWKVSLNDDYTTFKCDNCFSASYGVAGLYKIYESAFFLDKNQIWLAFVSANLKEQENENIIVFAPYSKKLYDSPSFIKEFTDYLVASDYFKSDSIKLLSFKHEKSWWEKLADLMGIN